MTKEEFEKWNHRQCWLIGISMIAFMIIILAFILTTSPNSQHQTIEQNEKNGISLPDYSPVIVQQR